MVSLLLCFYVSMFLFSLVCLFLCFFVSMFWFLCFFLPWSLCFDVSFFLSFMFLYSYVSLYLAFFVSMFLCFCFYVPMFLCFFVSLFFCFFVSLFKFSEGPHQSLLVESEAGKAGQDRTTEMLVIVVEAVVVEV